MATLLYSPEIRVHIQTGAKTIIDVSDDLQSGDLSLAENRVNTFSFALNNPRRKYDGVFTPNDRIVVQMKRIRWVQVFSGYLDEVPFFSIYPRVIPMKASDTLKRLKYRPWDAGTTVSYNLLHGGGSSDPNDARAVDGGLRTKTITLLTDVAEWPKANIHIGQLPSDWFAIVAKIQSKFLDEAAAQQAAIEIGGSASVGGSSTNATGVLSLPGPVRGQTGVLPATSGKMSTFGGPSDASTANGHMALTGESGYRPGVSPDDPHGNWYCAMRWPYVKIKANGSPGGYVTTSADAAKAIAWWKNRRLLITNPKNGKIVCVRAADWGPGGMTTANARVLDLAPAAALALGCSTNDEVEIRFAEDNTTPCGPITHNMQPLTSQHLTQNDVDTRQPTKTAAAAAATSDHPIVGVDVSRATTVKFEPSTEGGITMAPNVVAARTFAKSTWPALQSVGGNAKRNIYQTSKPSDHSRGFALDFMVSGGMPNAAQRALGNSIALFFTQNPNLFGTKYVIWNNHINGTGHTTEGWRLYDGGKYTGNATEGHYNHVHVSFTGGGDGPDLTALGTAGGGWAGSAASDGFWKDGFSTLGSVDGIAASGSDTPLLNTFNWGGAPDALSDELGGNKALMNDHPVLASIQDMVQASMRSFMAAPNGDFIAWFPDYFGLYGTAGRLHVADIEIAGDGFSVVWSDDSLITHQFTAGAPTGYNPTGSASSGEPVDELAMFTTAGIASVEYPEIMEALFNVVPSDPHFKKFFDGKTVLDRFGARPDYQPLGTITGPTAEFWYALYLFQRNWASQFSSQVDLTFMPEAWPGMLLVLDSYKFQAYIESVNHHFDFSDGGGFSTSVSIIAPSRIDGGGLYGLPAGGGHVAVAKKK